jgi:thiamine pyrophosphate-dependent acetolactate synthase large subunit-like protein
VTILISQALREQGIRIVRPRHEHNGVLIADGYARTSGDVGVCVVGPGPAIAQTGNALVTAQRKRSPVLVLLGQNPAEGPRGGLKDFDAQRFVESCGARYLTVRGTRTLADDIHEAFRVARLCAGPVVLALPDRAALGKPLPAQLTYRPTTRRSATVGVDAVGIEEAAAMLIDARRPLIFAGRGVVLADARDAVVALAERTGALLSTSLQARELFAGHPLDIGLFGSFATEGVVELVTEADCVLAIGVSLNPKQTGGARIAPNARIIHVDADPDRVGALSPVDLGIVGDALAVATAIDTTVAKADVPAGGHWAAARIAAARQRPPAAEAVSGEPLPASRVLCELDPLLPADRIVVVDGGLFTGFVLDQITVDTPAAWLWSLDFCSIGLGLGLAIGAALARPDKACVLFAGDGGFAMNLQELETVVREQIELTVVVLNDSGYAAEVCVLDAFGKPAGLAEFDDVDFARIAAGFGLASVTVRTTEDMDQVAEALRQPRLLVDAKVVETESHRYRRDLLAGALASAGKA